MEELATRSVHTEEDIMFLVESVKNSIKEAESILLDVKETFRDLMLSGIYDIFAELFYTLVIGVKTLADACSSGVERNLI